MPPRPHATTWLRSDQFLARSVAQPVARFLHIEAAGGILLVAAAVVALVWANSPWSEAYVDLFHTEISIAVGGHRVEEDLLHWINDGLMALFFFVIGLEIKQELVTGQLNSLRSAVVPVAGALGGMVLPAALYVAINLGESSVSGWGVPVATDVAFALGVLVLLGDRVPAELKVLLLGLAIADDIGAIVVIALVYTEDLAVGWLLAAAVGLVLIAALHRGRVRYVPVYAVIGSAIWFATFQSGVHATIAGAALGLLAPARPFLPQIAADRIAGELSSDQDVTAGEVRSISLRLRESVPVTERLQDLLHPWTSYVIVPLFALANAGVSISATALETAVQSPITIGVAVGLVVGKLVGVTGAIALVTRLGVGQLPAGINHRHVLGMAGLAGIGFTVSIFVAGLAFDRQSEIDEAKIGVLLASVVAALLGSALLRRARASAPMED